MKEINYYKQNEVLSHKYYQVPQELFTNKLYKDILNLESKLLYAFILDRLSLSIKNNWIDKNGNIYLIFTRKEVSDKLCLSDKPVTKAFALLTQVGLIEEKRQGLGKPNLIYVGKIIHEELDINNLENDVPSLNRKNSDSEIGDTTNQDTENVRTINTNNINTNLINTDSFYQEESNCLNTSDNTSLTDIKKQCNLYDFEEKDRIILEDVIDKLYNLPEIKIGNDKNHKDKILSKLKLINKSNLVFLLTTLKNTSNIKNVAHYLMICLYNNLGSTNKSNNKHIGRDYNKDFLDTFYDDLSYDKSVTN